MVDLSFYLEMRDALERTLIKDGWALSLADRDALRHELQDLENFIFESEMQAHRLETLKEFLENGLAFPHFTVVKDEIAFLEEALRQKGLLDITE